MIRTFVFFWLVFCVGLSARAPSPPAAQAPATQGSPEQNPPPAKAQQEAPTQPSSAPAQAPAAAKTPEGFVLEDGTPVRLRTGRNISSADAHVGDTLDFEVLEDVRVDGVLVIPKGGIAFATVTEAQSKRRMGRGGKLNVNIDSVRLVTHEKTGPRQVRSRPSTCCGSARAKWIGRFSGIRQWSSVGAFFNSRWRRYRN